MSNTTARNITPAQPGTDCGTDADANDYIGQVFQLLKEGGALVERAKRARAIGDTASEDMHLDAAAELLRKANALEDQHYAQVTTPSEPDYRPVQRSKAPTVDNLHTELETATS